MSESKTAGDRRAQHVALLGCVLQLVAFGVMFAISLWGDSHALSVLARFMLFGVPIWLMLYLVLNQIRRVRLEALETDELKQAQDAGTRQAIFELDDEALLLEQGRLKWMVRWLLPACTIFVFLFLIVGHFAFWNWSLDQVFDDTIFSRTKKPTLMMWFVVGLGFLCFLFARYALAVARLPEWRLLRAGAVCLAGSSLACLTVAIALMATGTIEWAEPVVTYALRVILLVLGLEFAVNLVLDMYRPRTAGEVTRPAFDSRLLGMVAEPGDIAKSIAEAFNYQFGFQVSTTWFYQLLQRWLFPITVVALIVVLSLTSVVIVDAGEQAVVERFGRLVESPTTVLGPGIHFKWPYPISIVRRAPVKLISELVIGDDPNEEGDHHHEAVLWTEEHEFVQEMLLLVAAPQLGEQSGASGLVGAADRAESSDAVAVSLLMMSVPIEYRINDIKKYLYNYDDPTGLLEDVAYQYLSAYAASVDIDELLGPGRKAFNIELHRLIQERVNKLDLGIDIVFAGLRGAHPPAGSDVAAAFQGVVSAQTNMRATIHAARGEAQRILTTVAGTTSHALALDEAIRAMRQLPQDSPELPAARERAEDLLLGSPEEDIAAISGRAAILMAEARAKASEKVSRAASKARVFGTQVAAYESAPELYRQRKFLEVYEDLQGVRKYVIVGDRSNVIIEYETTREAGLDQVLSEGVHDERKKRDARNSRNP